MNNVVIRLIMWNFIPYIAILYTRAVFYYYLTAICDDSIIVEVHSQGKKKLKKRRRFQISPRIDREDHRGKAP